MADTALPTHASAVVVGRGMGCSTLYHLAKMGVADAILLERDKLTSGTTWHSAAQVPARIVGETTSAAFGYRIGKPVALGYVKLDAPEGAEVEVDIGRQLF